MKLTKWVLLGVAGLALVFLPRRSSPKTLAQGTKHTNQTTHDHRTQNKQEHDEM